MQTVTITFISKQVVRFLIACLTYSLTAVIPIAVAKLPPLPFCLVCCLKSVAVLLFGVAFLAIES